MPKASAASAHWVRRWSVGQTTTTRSTAREASSSLASDSAKAVLPAPGVAVTRKSVPLLSR